MRYPGAGSLSLRVLAVAGCSGPTAVEENDVRVQAEDSRVEIENDRSVPIFVFLIEREFAAGRTSRPVHGRERVPASSPGRRSVDRSRIVGVDPGSGEAILHWWAVQPAGGEGFELTEGHAVVFPLE